MRGHGVVFLVLFFFSFESLMSEEAAVPEQPVPAPTETVPIAPTEAPVAEGLEVTPAPTEDASPTKREVAKKRKKRRKHRKHRRRR